MTGVYMTKIKKNMNILHNNPAAVVSLVLTIVPDIDLNKSI